MIAEDLAILERLAEEHLDPAVCHALRAALVELNNPLLQGATPSCMRLGPPRRDPSAELETRRALQIAAKRGAGGVLPVGRRQCTLAALIMLVTLAACVSERDALIEQGFAPAYAEGYDDGCASGSAAAGGLFDDPRKDAERYATDTQYTQGWDAGFAKCQRDTAAMVREARLRHPSGED